MKTKSRNKKSKENKYNITKKIHGGICPPESNVIGITYGGILGSLSKIFDTEKLKNIWNVLNTDEIKFMKCIQTIYLILKNNVYPNTKIYTGNTNTEELKNKLKNIQGQNIKKFKDLKEKLQDFYIPVVNGNMDTTIYGEYKQKIQPIHVVLIRNQFIEILKIFREVNDGKFYYADFNNEENKQKLDTFVVNFYGFGCNLIAFMKNIKDFSNIFSNIWNIGTYHNLFINIQTLLMHNFKFYSDSEFLRYECDDKSGKVVGLIQKQKGDNSYDDVKLMNNNHEVEKTLKDVLQTLFGQDIGRYIKYYPDILRQTQ
jgi:hypothetical protein